MFSYSWIQLFIKSALNQSKMLSWSPSLAKLVLEGFWALINWSGWFKSDVLTAFHNFMICHIQCCCIWLIHFRNFSFLHALSKNVNLSMWLFSFAITEIVRLPSCKNVNKFILKRKKMKNVWRWTCKKIFLTGLKSAVFSTNSLFQLKAYLLYVTL